MRVIDTVITESGNIIKLCISSKGLYQCKYDFLEDEVWSKPTESLKEAYEMFEYGCKEYK